MLRSVMSICFSSRRERAGTKICQPSSMGRVAFATILSQLVFKVEFSSAACGGRTAVPFLEPQSRMDSNEVGSAPSSGSLRNSSAWLLETPS